MLYMQLFIRIVVGRSRGLDAWGRDGEVGNVRGSSKVKSVRAGAVQIGPLLDSGKGAVEKLIQMIPDLGKNGAQFATFPEPVPTVGKGMEWSQ